MSVVLKIEDVWKQYRLGVINHGMLYKDIQSYIARKRGRPDPHLPEDAQIGGQGERFWALKGIDLEIEQGDRVGIIGRNGAGKSTLLKILSRVTAPTKGQIKVKGRIASLLEVGTGFHPELTGRENVYLNGAIMGMSKFEIKRKMDEIVDFAGVEKFIDTPVKRFSSGMHVRLGFSVAAHLEPEILVVDEVLAVGDAEFQKKALGKMEDVSKGEGRTILFVSHNIDSVQSLCNTGLVLVDGVISCYDRISTAISFYTRTNNSKSYYKKHLEKNNKPIIIESYFVDENYQYIDSYKAGDKVYLFIKSYSPDDRPFEYKFSFWDHLKRPLWCFTHTMQKLSSIKKKGLNVLIIQFDVPVFTVPEIYVHLGICPPIGPFYDNVVDALSVKIIGNQKENISMNHPEWPIFVKTKIIEYS